MTLIRVRIGHDFLIADAPDMSPLEVPVEPQAERLMLARGWDVS
jgi:hypothetical protein